MAESIIKAAAITILSLTVTGGLMYLRYSDCVGAYCPSFGG